ncbi:hypothetical protein HPB50_012600 [Hyalomma asiaticum]|uniref:Uncharacterized protein n=1 Tax=Hyalomma asiaticum TaxID=266040 RepID=A0ACB7S637_HYAAI|nr:hypothetical protein HPB50_012600 [Hyalomma asiaticum]
MERAERVGITDSAVSNVWADHIQKRHGTAYNKRQPLDAGIIENLEHSCRKDIVKRCPVHTGRGRQPTTTSVLDAMNYVASVWTTVNASNVQHCCKRCGFRIDDEEEAAMEAEETTESVNGLRDMEVAYDYAAVDAAS